MKFGCGYWVWLKQWDTEGLWGTIHEEFEEAGLLTNSQILDNLFEYIYLLCAVFQKYCGNGLSFCACASHKTNIVRASHNWSLHICCFLSFFGFLFFHFLICSWSNTIVVVCCFFGEGDIQYGGVFSKKMNKKIWLFLFLDFYFSFFLSVRGIMRELWVIWHTVWEGGGISFFLLIKYFKKIYNISG